jgi:hypothetical protein
MHVRQKVELMQDAHLGGHSESYLFIYVYILYKNFLYKNIIFTYAVSLFTCV